MALSDKAKSKRDKLSEFGEWLEEKAVSKGTSLQEVAQYIGKDYAFMQRLSLGTKSPTFEMAQQIGEMVDDVAGAVIAAGFNPPAAETPVPPPTVKAAPLHRRLSGGDELIVSPDDTDPDDTVRRVEAFLLALRAERAEKRGG